MAYLFPRSVMLHIPKTAGLWARRACRNAGLSWTRHDQHGTWLPDDGRFRFAFVRHPAEWLHSFWCYHMATGWRFRDSSPAFQLFECRSDQFVEFVENYLGRMPGFVTSMFEQYVGSAATPRVDFVGKTEDAAKDLTMALLLAGEIFHAEDVRNTPHINVKGRRRMWQQRSGFNRPLRTRICDAERQHMERWGYDQ